MVEILKRLTEARGVTGNENDVRQIIIELTSQLDDEVFVDKIGNVIVKKKGKQGQVNKKIMLDAHMDEVGFIISSISDNGMLKFRLVGSIDPRILVSKRVLIGKNAVPGVIGIKAIHLQEPDERNNAVQQKQMYIDIGVKSKDEAEKVVKLGDYAAFDSRFIFFGDNKVKAKSLDDRVGCGVLIELLKDSYDCDIYACFSVQEEIGMRGSEVAAYHVNPDLALIVEGTTCADIPDVPEHIQTTRLGMGPAISFMDHSSIANKNIYNGLIKTAKDHSIPFQIKENVSGSNDAGSIHKSGEGIATVVISVPCRYIHSPASVMDLEDYNNTILLMKEFLKGCVTN